MKYLVLGSQGQVGKPCVALLRTMGHDVREFYGDLRTPNNPILDQAIAEADYVYFLAWDVGGARYLDKHQNSYDFLMNNTLIMANTFQILARYNKPFLFTSSQMANMSFSPYGMTKALGDLLAKSLNGRIARLWNVYGPESDPEKTHVITDFIKMAKSGTINMRTTGEEERQFLYAEDCAEALYAISRQHDFIDKDMPLHIASFKWESVMDVAQIIQSLTTKNVNIVAYNRTDTTQHGIRNEPDPTILSLWKPKTSLRNGIKSIMEANNANVLC